MSDKTWELFLRRNAMPFFFFRSAALCAAERLNENFHFHRMISWLPGKGWWISLGFADRHIKNSLGGTAGAEARLWRGGEVTSQDRQNYSNREYGKPCCGGIWAGGAWLEIRRREQVSVQRRSERWERASSVALKNLELKPPTLNKMPLFASLIQWVFTHYLIRREFWNIFENYWIRCFQL